MAKAKDEPLEDREPRAAIKSLAGAVLNSKSSSETERTLAASLLASIDREPRKLDAPREAEGTAQTWMRQMDALINGADASRAMGNRAGRREIMAMALDGADLVVLDRATLARLVAADLERDDHPRLWVEPCAAEQCAAGGATCGDYIEPLGQDPGVND